MFWIDAMQINTGVMQKRIILKVWYRSLVQQVFTAWKEYFDISHGITQSKLERLIQVSTMLRLFSKSFAKLKQPFERKNKAKLLQVSAKLKMVRKTFKVWNQRVDQQLEMNLFLKVEKLFTVTKFRKLNQVFQSWQRNTRDNHEFGPQNQTPAEEFKKSARYQTLKSIIRSLLTKMRNNRLKNSAWRYLMKQYPPRANTADNDEGNSSYTHYVYNQCTRNCSSLINNSHYVYNQFTRACSILIIDAQMVLVNVLWPKIISISEKSIQAGSQIIMIVALVLSLVTMCSILGCFHIGKVLFIQAVKFLKWMNVVNKCIELLTLFFVFAQKGGKSVYLTFSSILKQIKVRTSNQQENDIRVAMPAQTRIISANEIKTKWNGFEKRLSLVDTGTDAYLRQDNQLMFPLHPASTTINTAGPDQLKASHSGLLNLLLKDDKGNVHQMLIENALLVPGLSQNLTSHKQFVDSGHLVFFHKNQSGIVLNKEPKFKPDEVIIPFITGANGLQYLEEYVPEEDSVMAMVAQKMNKLTNAELVHISLCHICPSLMRHLPEVATDIPKLRNMNFKCHCCVESKMKHAPKPPRSLRVITMPGQYISLDLVGPFRFTSIHGSKYGLAFIDHYTNTPFTYGLKTKDEFPNYLTKFLIDFSDLFRGVHVCELFILRSDNAAELNSAQVQQICLDKRIKRHFSILDNNFKMEQVKNVLEIYG